MLLANLVISFSTLIYDPETKLGANLIKDSLIDKNNNCCIIGLMAKFFLNMSNEDLLNNKYEEIIENLNMYFNIKKHVLSNIVHVNDEYDINRDIEVKNIFDKTLKKIILKREKGKI